VRPLTPGIKQMGWPMPDPPEPPKLQAMVRGFWVATTLGLFVVMGVLILGPQLQPETIENVTFDGLFWSAMAIFAVILMAMYVAYQMYLTKHEPAYEAALEEWQRQRFCTRCGHVFKVEKPPTADPGEAPIY
jgi:hypothetical protein